MLKNIKLKLMLKIFPIAQKELNYIQDYIYVLKNVKKPI